MRQWMVLGVLGALAAAPVPAFAQQTAVRDDARCVLVMNVLSQQEKYKTLGEAAMVYFVGRLDGRGVGANLKTLLDAEAKAMTQPLAQTEAQRCVAVFQARGAQLRAMGQPPAGAPPPKPKG